MSMQKQDNAKSCNETFVRNDRSKGFFVVFFGYRRALLGSTVKQNV